MYSASPSVLLVLTCDLACGTARPPITVQPHLYPSDPLVRFQSCRFGALTLPGTSRSNGSSVSERVELRATGWWP